MISQKMHLITIYIIIFYIYSIQDVGVFVSTVFLILIFVGPTVLVCQSYHIKN